MIRMSVWVGGLLAALWVLVGCTAAAPPPSAPAATTEAAPVTGVTPTSPPAAPGCLVITQDGVQWLRQCDGQDGPPYTTAMRDAACQDIIPFKADDAYNANPNEPLGWTFGVNFYANTLLGDQPVGCLRLYYANKNVGKYVAIDGGGVLVDTCKIVGSGNLPMANGEADFCHDDKEKAVVCSVNLEDWVASSAIEDYVTATADPLTADIISAIKGFTPAQHVHTYNEMALVGVAKWPDSCNWRSGPMPLITYVPEDPAPPQPQLWLTLSSKDTTLEPPAEVPDPVISFSAPCTYPIQPYWWDPNLNHQIVTFDLYQTPTGQPPFVEYAYQPSGPTSVQTCPDSTAGNTIDLWEGKANLWIGSAPDFKPEGSFQGVLDGVLIDPYDSKPPTKVDPTN